MAKFSAAVWTSGTNVTIREIDADSLSKTGSKYSASLNMSPAVMLKLLNSPADVEALKKVLALGATDPVRVAQIAKSAEKKAGRAVEAVLRDAKSAVKLCKDRMIDSAKRDEILQTLAADNPDAAEAIASLAL